MDWKQKITGNGIDRQSTHKRERRLLTSLLLAVHIQSPSSVFPFTKFREAVTNTSKYNRLSPTFTGACTSARL